MPNGTEHSIEFLPHQVYKDAQGFPISKDDDYDGYGLPPLSSKQRASTWNGQLLCYFMTPGSCPAKSAALTQ